MDPKALKSLPTTTILAKGGSALIKKMMDCDTPQESFNLLKAAGFSGTFQTFQSDLKNLKSLGAAGGISTEIINLAAMCTPDDAGMKR